MIKFSSKNENYNNDLMELIRLFEQRIDENFSIDVDFKHVENHFEITVSSDKLNGYKKVYSYPFQAKDEMEVKRYEKRFLKMAIYQSIYFLTGVTLPYGCLTGIRPTKLYLELGDKAEQTFSKDYCVSQEKLHLIKQIVSIQKPLRNQDEESYDIFVFIPFCPTKCAYCSFVSKPIGSQKKIVEPYVDDLCIELDHTHEIVEKKGLKIRAVYVGGGTPTSLPAPLLDKVLSHCHFDCSEFTVEAGRPDTINQDIIDVLKKHKVTRVSINPQTFNNKTLKAIGRKHTAGDVLDAYDLVKDDFDVNMDLIAMLPGETFEDFKRSVDNSVALNPENITVHTLYLKKGSLLREENYHHTDYDTAVKMVDYAYKKLSECGYVPYYMYRQKYTSGNLENVGYAKPGRECIYNIDIMEEDTSILANGAAAISKKYTKAINLIERNANYKEPLEYVKHFDLMMERSKKFWE